MRRGLSSRWLCGLALASMTVAGCRHRGGDWAPRPDEQSRAEPAGESVEIIVLGQPRASAATTAVAHELERTLAAAGQAGRTTLIAWLGTDLGRPGPDRASPCPAPADTFTPAPLAELARVVEAAGESGVSAWGLPGPDGLRCPSSTPDEAALPYRQPALSYVLRVHASGQVELASQCTGDRCELLPAAEGADIVVELAVFELSAWHYPELLEPDAMQTLLARQSSLLEAFAAQPGPPRLLLSPIPVDSAGPHGLGGRLQRTGYRYLPEPMREAIARGIFVGAIGALERDLQVSSDLSASIHRNHRTFIDKPMFGVVSGAAGGASHAIPTSRADALLPELESEHAGFVSVVITGDRAHVRVHARIAGRWKVGGLALALHPEPLGETRAAPTIQPCPGCDPLPGAADGEPFAPRGPQLR